MEKMLGLPPPLMYVDDSPMSLKIYDHCQHHGSLLGYFASCIIISFKSSITLPGPIAFGSKEVQIHYQGLTIQH